MASWMIHLRVAQRVLEMAEIPDAARFVLGNMAPDSGIVTDNGYLPDKDTTHFRFRDGEERPRIHPETYAARYLVQPTDLGARSFHLGYFCHLLTDLKWNQQILPHAKAAFPDVLSADPAAFWRMVKRDWYDMDFLYLRAHPDFRAWQIYCGMTEMRNAYVDFFSETAFADRRAWIMDFYREGASAVRERETYLPWAVLDAFVEDAARGVADAITKGRFA